MIYQIIKHEYAEDDGHYEHGPVDDIVYANEADAIKIRDNLNFVSIEEYHTELVDYARMAEEEGWEPKQPDWVEKRTFKGDPKDADQVARYARRHYAKFYTVATLRLFK